MQIHFKSKEGSNNSLLGGVLSLFIKAFMLYFVGLNFKEMIFYEKDRWISVTWATDPKHTGSGYDDPSIINIREMGSISLSLRSNKDYANLLYN